MRIANSDPSDLLRRLLDPKEVSALEPDQVAELMRVMANLLGALAPLIVAMPGRSDDASGASMLVDAKVIAEDLGVKESWVREAARQGRIPCVHVGRWVRFDRTAVARVLEESDGL